MRTRLAVGVARYETLNHVIYCGLSWLGLMDSDSGARLHGARRDTDKILGRDYEK